jgi:uncharacterized protein (DUF983 family)
MNINGENLCNHCREAVLTTGIEKATDLCSACFADFGYSEGGKRDE